MLQVIYKECDSWGKYLQIFKPFKYYGYDSISEVTKILCTKNIYYEHHSPLIEIESDSKFVLAICNYKHLAHVTVKTIQ